MKNILKIVALSSAFLCVGAMAAPQVCGYTDHIHLSNNAKLAKPKIQGSLQSSGYVLGVQTGPSKFDIHDHQPNNECVVDSTGTVTVRYALNSNSYCDLTFTDGPYLENPSVDYNCHNLTYLGMNYDGFGTYSYSLMFIQ